jgi:polyisoprenoid-binding protein YceI
MPDRSWLPGRPKSKRSLLLTIGGAAAVVAVAGFALVYFVLFPTSSPPKFALATTTSSEATQTQATSVSGFAGDWSIASGSQAGYRVREKLAFLPAQSQAVGRTSSVTGTATLTGPSISVKVTKASFVIDVSTLKSDKSMRDEKIHTIGLESDRYSKATFVLSKPIDLPASAADGKVADVAATGALTIHGSTQTVTIPVEMRLTAAKLEAAGSITFPWSKFAMTAPSVGGFVNVTDSATMEFELKLTRS